MPSRTSAATCSCASRKGTPSRTRPRRRRSHAAADRRLRRRAAPVELEALDEHESAASASARRAARRTPAACPPAGRGRTRAEALHDREQAGQPPDHRARLAAHELGDVGIELLRHHRRARRRRLGQAHEAELARRPEDELLADPRQVREQHRARVEVVEREVAVGDGVERVAHLLARRRRQRQRRARERAGAERRRRRRRVAAGEAHEVALEHLDPREQVMADRHGIARWRCV